MRAFNLLYHTELRRILLDHISRAAVPRCADYATCALGDIGLRAGETGRFAPDPHYICATAGTVA